MLIEVETLQNQNALTFHFGKRVLENQQIEYATVGGDKNSDLMKKIFLIKGIERALLTPDFLFVEKTVDASWKMLSPQIMAEISDYDFQTYNLLKSDDASFEIVDALIEAIIKPYIVSHHGNIELVSCHNGVVKVRLKGACRGCQHALSTLKNIVEERLKTYLKGIQTVEREV